MPVCRCAEEDGGLMGSVIKKRRKRMAKKKHRKLLKRTRAGTQFRDGPGTESRPASRPCRGGMPGCRVMLAGVPRRPKR